MNAEHEKIRETYERNEKILLEMDFIHSPMLIFETSLVKGYGEYGSNGELIVHIDGTFNIRCYSSVFEEAYADILALREKGVLK